MKSQRERLLDHCIKGAQTGVIALGQMLPHCRSKEVYAFVEESAARYRDYATETTEELRKDGVKPEHIGRMASAMVIKVVGWRCRKGVTDKQILQQVRDGAVKSAEACERYRNLYAGAGPDALGRCTALEGISRDVEEKSYLVRADGE